MFRILNDFFITWKLERESTEKIFSALSDEVLKQKSGEDCRSLGRLAGHIVESVKEMASRAGIGVEYHDEILKFDNVKDILINYKNACNEFESKLKANWTDAILTGTIDMYGQQWARGKILFVLITHQIHHRAQMTVLMRLAGLKVPGTCGPAKEEWAAMGMPAME